MGPIPSPARPAEPPPGSAWRETGGAAVLCVSEARLILTAPGAFQVHGLEHKAPGSWRLRKGGRLETWKVSVAGDLLKTEVAGRQREFRRLPAPPKDCDLRPLPVGHASLSPERKHAIHEEIVTRLKRDQAAIGGTGPGGLAVETLARENTQYLRDLIREVGWIDIARFDEVASGNAVILAQHSGDLPLMMTILPFVERDLKTSPKGNHVFAVLHDRVQILLGRKQRYGSQLGEDAEGNPMVLPLEDPARVDEIRKAIGLSSFAEYFELTKELYPGKTIRMPRAEE